VAAEFVLLQVNQPTMHLANLLFLDISSGELIVIVLVAFLVFGPRRIPEMARQAGKWMNEVRRVTSDIRREIREETRKVTDEFDPMKSPDKEGTA